MLLIVDKYDDSRYCVRDSISSKESVYTLAELREQQKKMFVAGLTDTGVKYYKDVQSFYKRLKAERKLLGCGQFSQFDYRLDNETNEIVMYRAEFDCDIVFMRLVIPKFVEVLDFNLYDLEEGYLSIGDIVFPEGLRRICSLCFSLGDGESCGFRSLSFPDSLQTIDSEAFSGNRMLESVTFGRGISTIGSFSFEECGLREIFFPKICDKPVSVGMRSFAHGLYKLESVRLPESSLTVEETSFYDTDCGGLDADVRRRIRG